MKRSFGAFLGAVSFLPLLLAPAYATGLWTPFQAVGTPSPTPSPSGFQPLKIGGGGFLRGLDVAADGTKVVRADTYGAYYWDGTTWVELVTSTSMPSGDPVSTPQGCLTYGCGVYEIRIAPSDTNVAYMMVGGYTYKTSNLKSGAGVRWSSTAFPQCTTCSSNAGYSQDGPHLGIDPANANIVAVGVTTGVYYSLDGGVSISGPIASIPQSISNNGEGYLIVADPSTKGVSSTTVWYVSSYGHGVYRTNAGLGGTFSIRNGGPTLHTYMTVGPDGELYYVPYSPSDIDTLYLFNGSVWSTQATGTHYISGIALDPAHPTFASNAHLTAVSSSGIMSYTSNSGQSWSGANTPNTRVCTGDIAWLCNTNEGYMSAGEIAYDPSRSNVVDFAEGVGFWWGNPSPGTSTWNAQTTCIEQMVSDWAITPPGGSPMFAFWDRPIFTQTNLNAYPSQHGLNYTNSIIMGAAADFAKSSPSTVFVAADWFSTESTGKTNNGGGPDGGPSNWSLCPTTPSMPSPNAFWGSVANGGNGWAGAVAASTPNNFMWSMTDDAGLFYTTDGCATWHIAQPPGIVTTPNGAAQGWGHAYYVNRHIICADKNSGYFYAYNALSASLPGIYKFSSGGAVGSRVYSGHIDGADGWNATMNCVPGVAGEMFFTSGNATPGPFPHNNMYLNDCVDSAPGTTGGTVRCTPLLNVKEAWAFGFGAAKPGGSGFPAIFVIGWVNGAFGLYESDDHAVSWTLLATYPCNSLDVAKVVTGDLNNYGRVYIGFSGSSFCYNP